MTEHTSFLNKLSEFEDPEEVNKWIRKNLSLDLKVGIIIQLNYDHTIREIIFNKKLTQANKTKLITKFPELEGKEIEI